MIADNGASYARLYYGVPRGGRILTLINQRLSPNEQVSQLANRQSRKSLSEIGTLPRQRCPTFDDRFLRLEHILTFDDRAVATRGARVDCLHRPRSTLTKPLGCCSPVDRPEHAKGCSAYAPIDHHCSARHRRGPIGALSAACTSCPFRCATSRGTTCWCTTLHTPRCCPWRPSDPTHSPLRSTRTACDVMLSRADHDARPCLHFISRTPGIELPTLRDIAYGSAAIPADLLRRALARLDVGFHQGLWDDRNRRQRLTFLGPAEHRAGAAGDASILATAGKTSR